jgi:hypothetical protein
MKLNNNFEAHNNQTIAIQEQQSLPSNHIIDETE